MSTPALGICGICGTSIHWSQGSQSWKHDDTQDHQPVSARVVAGKQWEYTATLLADAMQRFMGDDTLDDIVGSLRLSTEIAGAMQLGEPNLAETLFGYASPYQGLLDGDEPLTDLEASYPAGSPCAELVSLVRSINQRFAGE